MRDYPQMYDHTASVEPAPRRVRGFVAGQRVFDTVSAVYVWESPRYPFYYVPTSDVAMDLLHDDDHEQRLKRGTARAHSLVVGGDTRKGAARVFGSDATPGVVDTVRFEWAALDAWFEEDEQIFVHPRNPYTRVDALRSRRTVRVEWDGLVLAESDSTVMVFETGLPTRYYLDRSDVDFTHLVPSATVTECPYKGTTTGYWSLVTDEATVPDLAWCYDFPTRQLLPVAGLVAFYNERVDMVVDGLRQERPTSPFS